MNSKIIFSLALASSFLFSVSPVKALTVDLKAKPLTQSTWSDNLDQTQTFNPGDKFQVQLSIKNSTTAPETQIQVESKLAKAIDLNEFGVFRIVDIEPGEEYVRVFTATVKNAAVAQNQISFSAKAQNGDTGTDTLNFVINVPTVTATMTATPTATIATAAATATKSATKKAVLPKTGPADVAYGTIIAALVAIIAYNLRSLVRGY